MYRQLLEILYIEDNICCPRGGGKGKEEEEEEEEEEKEEEEEGLGGCHMSCPLGLVRVKPHGHGLRCACWECVYRGGGHLGSAARTRLECDVATGASERDELSRYVLVLYMCVCVCVRERERERERER